MLELSASLSVLAGRGRGKLYLKEREHMYCSSCGIKIDESGRYCAQCGAAIGVAATHSAPQEHVAQEPKGGKLYAGWSLALGIIAATIPVPVLDIAIGVAGICLYSAAKKNENSPGLTTAGLVMSIFGTVVAVLYTLSFLYV